MTGLAAHAEAVPLTVKAVVERIEVAFVAGGVAFHAHEVGVLVGFAPVQRVLEGDALAWIEMKPAAFLCIPGHAQGLQAPVADFEQILLQRRDAKGVGHLEVGRLAIAARRVDPELIAALIEPRGFTFGTERGVVEIRRDRLRRGGLHRQLVVRALPVLGLGLVAALALLLVDQLRRGRDDHRFGRRHGRRSR